MLSLLECTIQNLKLVQRKPKNQVWKQWWLLRRPWLDWKSWMISGWWQWWSCQWCIFMQLCWQSHQKRVIAAAGEVICCFWSSFSNKYFVEPSIKVDDGERANEIKKKWFQVVLEKNCTGCTCGDGMRKHPQLNNPLFTEGCITSLNIPRLLVEFEKYKNIFVSL